MTHNQIEYAEHLENVRHNKESETELGRHNQATEKAEIERNRISDYSARETARSNRENERIRDTSNAINAVSAQGQYLRGLASLESARESSRHNIASELESQRHNVEMEANAMDQVSVARQNARTSQLRAINDYEISQRQLDNERKRLEVQQQGQIINAATDVGGIVTSVINSMIRTGGNSNGKITRQIGF